MNFAILTTALFCLSAAPVPTTIDGSTLAFHSTGAACADGAWRLDENGFIGTYIQVAKAGPVSFTIRAAKGDAGTTVPMLRLRVADSSANWPVAATIPNYETCTQAWTLPAGTYCVRIESTRPAGAGLAIQVRELSVTGAAVLNAATDANALLAADTYVEHFRKGPAAVTLTADGRPLANAAVHVRLKCHAFNFGTALSSTFGRGSSWLDGSDANAVNYRKFVLRNFNMVVPENAGKWGANERARDAITLDSLDRIMDFAESNGKRLRMHGVLWDVAEPAWVDALQETALKGATAAERDAAKANLRAKISERIGYLVKDRAHRYRELDILNEAAHRPMYFRIYGNDGVAGIYNEVKAAVQAAGASTLCVPNEYDVLQSTGKIGDPYANWYRQHVEAIRDAGGAVDGIGIQYYAVDGDWVRDRNPHSPSRIAQVLHNLATANLPLAICEFGVQKAGDPTPERAAEILAEALRLSFGHEKMTTFISWGFWRPKMWATAPVAALVDADWNITFAGKVWQQITGVEDWKLAGVPAWNVDVTLSTDAQGRLNFTGFYGDYEIVSDGLRGGLTLAKGTDAYAVALNAAVPGRKSEAPAEAKRNE